MRTLEELNGIVKDKIKQEGFEEAVSFIGHEMLFSEFIVFGNQFVPEDKRTSNLVETSGELISSFIRRNMKEKFINTQN